MKKNPDGTNLPFGCDVLTFKNETIMTNIELETLSAVKAAARKYVNEKNIDWEQRRYEIAKDVLAARLSNSNPCITDYKKFAEKCVDFADALIEKLKD